MAIHHQFTQNLKRAATLEFTAIPPIFYIQCYVLFINFHLKLITAITSMI